MKWTSVGLFPRVTLETRASARLAGLMHSCASTRIRENAFKKFSAAVFRKTVSVAVHNQQYSLKQGVFEMKSKNWQPI
ncbi:hypothetical protein ACWKWK_12365 [Pseudoxanthomonas beigongshangi]